MSDTEHLADVLRAAPDHGGWRAGMDADDYRDLARAVLAAGYGLRPGAEPS